MAYCDSALKTLEQLRCTKCNLYLSVGPVRFTKDGYFCGRCKNAEGSIVTIYSVVAQSFLFPCRYEKSGCKEKFYYGKMEQHEMACDKRPFFCPSLKKCYWQGVRKNIYDHYLQEHPDDVIEDNEVMKICLKENNQRCVLFVYDKSMYFVDLIFDVEFGLKMSVMQCGFEDGFNKYNAKFSNEDNSKELCLNSQSASFYVNNRNDALIIAKRLEIGIINYFKCDELRLELNFPQTESNDPLKVLECPVCIEYMLPPIFLCDMGHSFCHSCTKKLSVCSFCKSRFTNRRNYALENFAEMAYPKCRNSRFGCKFRGNLEEVKIHESSCGRYQCPLLALVDVKDTVQAKKCRWYGSYDEMVAHVLSAHTCEEKDNFTGACNVHSDKESFLLFYAHGFMFNLCSKSVVMKTLQFNVQFVGPRERVSDFDVVVQFREGRSKLVYRHACQLMGENKDPFEECLTIPYDILVPFIENRCYVKVNIRIVNIVDRIED